MDDHHTPLSTDELGPLLARMSTAPRPVSKAAPARKAAKRASFENHSLYRQLSLQRSFAQLSDIANPYYSVHAVKAEKDGGAAS